MVTDTHLPAVQQAPQAGPQLGPFGTARWAWRQLTSMRTALLLLLLLALASVPGSVLPQRGIDQAATDAWLLDHATIGPVLDRLGGFNAYSSPWFAAVYLLLFTSLAGCVLPRARVHLGAMRARPPAAPRNLDRLPEHRSWTTEAAPDVVLAAARSALRTGRFRTVRDADSVAAEKGYLRETGNLVFHLALLALLIAFAATKLLAFTGNKVVVEGGGFTNAIAEYDTFSHGSAWRAGSLAPVTVTLDSFSARYQESGDQTGAPREFKAAVHWEKLGTSERGTAVISPNHPLNVDGTKFFLTGNGFAPTFRFTDATGKVVFDGADVLLPRDANLTSSGALKLPDAKPQSLGMQMFFLPSAVVGKGMGPQSSFPAPRNPRVLFNVFYGDMHDDRAQSVFTLDTSDMTILQTNTTDKAPFVKALSPGESVILHLPGAKAGAPPGATLGTLTFTGYHRFVNFQVSDSSGNVPAVVAAGLAIVGLMMSLLLPRRRVWVRATATGGATVVDIGAMARGDAERLADEVDRVRQLLEPAAPPIPSNPDPTAPALERP